MKRYSHQELLYIWLGSFYTFETTQKFALFNILKQSQSINEAIQLNKEQIQSVLGEDKFKLLLENANQERLKEILSSLEKFQITAITPASIEYPKSLNALGELAPVCLYAKGDVSLLKNEKSIGIVGSRKSLPLTLKVCAEYSEALTKNGVTLVTGIAEGADVTAIKSALKVGGKVISVLAGGLDSIYPKAHTEIVNELSTCGLVISEQPPLVRAQPFMFPFRNRIISALADKTLIVSAGERSGALYTADYSMKLGKEVYVFPYNIGVQSGVGCNALIKNGGLLTDKIDDVLSAFGIENLPSEVIDLTDDEKAVIKAIKDGECHIEKIGMQTGKKTYMLFPVLSMLEIKGIIFKNGINVYGLTAKGMQIKV